MNDFLRRLTLLSLIPRQPVPPTATPTESDHTPLPRGKTSTQLLLTQLQERGYQGNLRAIQRDLVFLQKQLPELLGDGTRAGGQGWCWRWDTPVLDLPRLDPGMALTFAMAQDLLAPLLPAALLRRLQPYFQAAQKVLEASGSTELKQWKQRVKVIPSGQPLLPAKLDATTMEVVQTALQRQLRFRGRYASRNRHPPAEYEFNPLGLVFRERVVYLVATVWDYQDPRHYALHRFQQVTALEQPATVPPGFDLDTYLNSGTFQYSTALGTTITLELRLQERVAGHLRETPLSEDQQMSEPEQGWVQLTATVLDTDQLYWWLLGFGAQVEVLAPPTLRQRLVTSAQALAALYASPQAPAAPPLAEAASTPT